MQPLPSRKPSISLAAGHARLARGDFNHVLPLFRQHEIMRALRRAPAVYEAVVGVCASDLIPCNVDELDALTHNSRITGVPPQGAGFSRPSEFIRWYTALIEFFHLLAAPDTSAVGRPTPLWWERPPNSTVSRAVHVAA